MATKIVLRVDLPDDRQKKKALRALSTLSGIDSVAMDTRAQKMTVIGCVDPVDVVYKLRKLWFTVHIATVSSIEEEKKKKTEEKKDGDKKKEDRLARPYRCIYPYPYPYPCYIYPEEFTLDLLKHITNNFSEDHIIGRGRHGAIYKGVRGNGECIAVKKLRLKPGLGEEEYKNVFNKLSWIRHKNTIRLVGYCHHIAQVPAEHKGEKVSATVEERALCFQYLEGQSLDDYLSADEPCRLPWYRCYKIIREICEGLHYLHKELEHPIYHLELKPTNIMLGRDHMIPQIGGFGLSLFDSLETNDIPEDMETSVHMPPEYINKQQISTKFDVFSLGVTIIQIMAGKDSYSKFAHTPEKLIQLVHEFWEKGLPETIWRHTSDEVRACIEIALKCVKSDQVMRPTITEILDKLKKIYIADCSSINQLYRTREFTIEFLERITNNFSTQNKVGSGGFGVIYKGVLENGEEIAVKKLQPMLWIDNEQFKNELNNLMRVRHKNIVRLVGYCHSTEQIITPYKGELVSARVDQRALCLEYLQGGSLDNHISGWL